MDRRHLDPSHYDLAATRKRLGVTQAVMADAMGMPLRSYQDVENGPNPLRPIHVRAALYAELDHLARTGDWKAMSADAYGLAMTVATKFTPPPSP